MIARRGFVKGTVGGLGLVTIGGFMPAIFGQAIAQASQDYRPSSAGSTPPRTLIVVQLAGGNDGLNTVIPHADGLYRDNRPTLGIPDDQIVKLTDRLGLHPSLAPLRPHFDGGRLAIVQSVGYPQPSLSHFQSMDIWQTADPQAAHYDGWLASLVGGSVDAEGHPFQAVSIGSALSPALCCPTVPPPTFNNVTEYTLQSDTRFPAGANTRAAALNALYNSYQAPAPYAALLDATADTAQFSSQQIVALTTAHVPATTYSTSSFGRALKLLASLICGNAGIRVGYLTLGGFDTHANQPLAHTRLLKELGDGLAAFYGDLVAHGKDQNAAIMTWSEFGRRVPENASLGTDHGTAAPLFVLGTPVKGGFYGDPPNLGNLDRGNLRHQNDFRAVYATVLQNWLGANATTILGQAFAPIPFL